MIQRFTVTSKTIGPKRACKAPRRANVLSITALFAVAFSLVTNSFATPGQPGTLDATWATISPLGAGKVITPIGNGDDFALATAVQPDGKVLLAGYCVNGTSDDFCAVRYNSNGTLDLSWNGTGMVVTPVGNNADRAYAIALQSDGKVLLAGACSNGVENDICAVRYNANGTLDTSWNGSGKVMTPGSSSDHATAMVVQPDGKVLLGGTCYNSGIAAFCAVRYNANGTLDTSWNGTGKVTTAVSIGNDIAEAMVLQPDGKVLLAGYCAVATSADFCAVRYNPNGTLDSNWNGTGKVITAVGSSSDFASAMALQPDGKVLLAGRCLNGTSNNFCAVRYNIDGTLDAGWSADGKVFTAVGGINDNGNALVVQPDGKILISGYCSNGTNFHFCAVRYHSNATLDQSWNGTGKVTTQIASSGDTLASAMVLQPDGKVLLAGYCGNGININFDFCAARYDGGPFGYKACSLDIDGDNQTIATIDGLISTRVMLGMTGAAVINDITFAPHARRNTWPLIRDYLVTQCGMVIP